ncbi:MULTISPECIES: ABC transporter permease subunit [unclassified Solwaraspora]|uniref:ABC transporter permease subunit n=1 Tax=unclassified Solwaraspora TaxID=2627926 RepID=UPI00248C17BF|nr:MULTISPECIES: ABC transporter permease subunit [unclassified Solwaraspora]WBB98107.1 ABC transporter permease subunit [Solwaraspora sp. WMMA2059]WBC23338.1 ABC transporter permease subunit [Solwaraspora sp. WMMA2080]WJK34579.1 ABC transporter permease subunit [Solwaraspora sp. WMMA2065]
MNLVRSELLKITTTATWWVFGLIYLPLWAVTLLVNYVQTSVLSDPERFGPTTPENDEVLSAVSEAPALAANLYTNGQFFGLLVVMLLGVIVVTNEYFHQTATTTFLTSPRRTEVVLAKLAAASLLGFVFWLITTVVNLIAGALVLATFDIGAQFGSGAVWEAVGLNGLAYLLWAIFGVGFGVLIRSQLGATVSAILLYLGGYLGTAIILATLASRFGDWVSDLQWLVPSIASQLMVAGTDLPDSPPRWTGALILIGYALLTGIVGTVITRRRDIS